jgi:chromosome segregation ATPase
MLLEDEMEQKLRSAENIAEIKPIPRKRLNRINNTAQSLNELLDTIKSSEDDAQSLIDDIDRENPYLKQAKNVEQEFQVLNDRNEDSIKSIEEQKKKLTEIRKTLSDQNQQVSELTNQLAHFSHGNQALEAGEVDYLVNEADMYLKGIRSRNEQLTKQFNYAKKSSE